MNLTDYNIPLIFFVSFVLTIWFESDIVYTIGRLFKTEKLLKIHEFVKYKLEVDALSNYPNFLYGKYPGYFTKLISCPLCLCFWLTLLTTNILVFLYGMPQYYFILVAPINYIISLIIYLIIRKLL